MVKKYLLLITTLVTLLLVVVITPTFAEEFTGNKCYDEWECGDGTTDESKYWWETGWCAAAIDAGIISGTISDCTSSPDDDYVEVVVIKDDDDGKRKKIVITVVNCQAFYAVYIDFGNGDWVFDDTFYIDDTCETAGDPTGTEFGYTLAGSVPEATINCQDNMAGSSVANNQNPIYACTVYTFP